MSVKLIALVAASASVFLPACGKKSEAQENEAERLTIREEKRKRAILLYRTFAREYFDDPRADDAKKRASALEAEAPKK